MSADLLIRLPDYVPSLINAMHDGFVLRAIDGTILDVNRAFCAMTGFDRAEVVGTRAPHPWWPEEEYGTLERMRARYLTEEASEQDLVFRRRSGERFDVVVTNAPLLDADEQVIGFMSTVKDLTERVHAEQQIQLQAQLLDQVQAAVVATDAANRVIIWNEGATALFGWSRPNALGRDIRNLVADRDTVRMAEQILAQLREGDAWEGEFLARRVDGQYVPTLATYTPMVDRAGRFSGAVSVWVDISERKQAEQRLAAQYAVTRGLSQSATLRAGLRAALGGIGSNLGWQVGAFWAVDETSGTARCTQTWTAPDIDRTMAAAVVRDRVVKLDGDWLGRARSSASPIWMRDLTDVAGSDRSEQLAVLGLRSGIVLPVQIGDQIAGMFEFFSTMAREPDAELLATASAIGSQVGQFIERMRAESALRESEDRFRTMADSAPVLLWVAGTDGRCTWFNRVWLDFTGRALEQEIGNGWTHGIHPSDVDRYVSTYQSSFQARQPFTIEYRLRRHDGEYCWVLATGIPRFGSDDIFLGYIGSAIDISDRKRAEEDQLFLSEATRILASSLDYRSTLASVAQLAVPHIADWCVVHIEGQDGQFDQITVANADPEKIAWAAELQQRYPADMDVPAGLPHVLHTGTPELYPVITDEQFVAAARDDEHLAMLREGGITSGMIVPIVARERVLGAMTFISAELGRHYGPEDLVLAEHLAHRAGVAIDNAMLYEEAQEASRARDQFLAVAAHELRSPLTSMKGFAQLLLRRAERVPGGDEWRSGLQTIDMQVNRVSELVNRLLDVSRIEERRLQLETAPVDVVEIVRGAAAEVRLTSEQHRIVVRAGRKRQLASVDRMRIEQVLFNLLDNAIKYSPAGTTVEVAVSDAADEVVVSVHDQGDGIPPDVRERLFERYFRGAGSARAASEGLGLGLYVAHGIVDAHGGRMWLESDVGHGSTFAFSLPRLTQASTVAAPVDARSAEATAE